VEEGVRRVSEGAAALVGGLGGGLVGGVFVLIGVLAGLWFERWLRSRGELRCVLGTCERSPYTGSDREARASYRLDLRFFNEKDEDTGIYGLSVAFIDKDGGEAILGPIVSGRGPTRVPDFGEEPRDLLNFPPQRWTATLVSGSLQGADAMLAAEWERVEARGRLPNGELYRCEIRNRKTGSWALFTQPPSS